MARSVQRPSVIGLGCSQSQTRRDNVKTPSKLLNVMQKPTWRRTSATTSSGCEDRDVVLSNQHLRKLGNGISANGSNSTTHDKARPDPCKVPIGEERVARRLGKPTLAVVAEHTSLPGVQSLGMPSSLITLRSVESHIRGVTTNRREIRGLSGCIVKLQPVEPHLNDISTTTNTIKVFGQHTKKDVDSSAESSKTHESQPSEAESMSLARTSKQKSIHSQAPLNDPAVLEVRSYEKVWATPIEHPTYVAASKEATVSEPIHSPQQHPIRKLNLGSDPLPRQQCDTGKDAAFQRLLQKLAAKPLEGNMGRLETVNETSDYSSQDIAGRLGDNRHRSTIDFMNSRKITQSRSPRQPSPSCMEQNAN